MELYSFLREFADSWGLLFMFLAFGFVIFWVYRPGSRELHDEAAQIPLRNDKIED